MKNYLFSFGDSNTDAIGCCVRVRIHPTGDKTQDKKLALAKARNALRSAMTDQTYFQVVEQNSNPDQEIEYCNVYINPDKIFLKHIEKLTDAGGETKKDSR